MGVVIEKIDGSNEGKDSHFATVLHQDHRINAVVFGPFDRVKNLVGASVTAEYELKNIESSELDLPLKEGASGIFQETPDTILIDGTVHLLTPVDDQMTLIDIYIQNGADFLAISSDDVERVPTMKSRIRIRGRGLVVYPTYT